MEWIANLQAAIKEASSIFWTNRIYSGCRTCLYPQKRLTVWSKKTGNDDTRGGGCGRLNLPASEFTWSADCPKGVTLRHLTEGVYRMKGSKYDLWYELYSGFGSDPVVSDCGEAISVEVGFDYGS